MLEAHLNPDTDAASRRPEFIDRSVEWILSLPLPENACLLDIGCGPGLYAKRFAARGMHVTGIDFSARSIAYAKEHDTHSEYIQRDYLTMDYEDAFDIVTLIYCDYGALIPKEREELLRRLYRALKPGGLFVFDVFTPRYHTGHKNRKSCKIHLKGGFWSPKPHICLSADYSYDNNIRVSCCANVDCNGLRRYNIWDTCYTQQSLLDEITPAGFALEAFYGDVAGATLTGDSETICAVWKKN